jgi:hypothetical protein
MRDELPFASWADRCGVDVLNQVRSIFRGATEELIAAGGNQDKDASVAILRRAVDSLNDLDDSIGFIETPEAEALVRRVEELGSLVGIDNHDERLTGHLHW